MARIIALHGVINTFHSNGFFIPYLYHLSVQHAFASSLTNISMMPDHHDDTQSNLVETPKTRRQIHDYQDNQWSPVSPTAFDDTDNLFFETDQSIKDASQRKSLNKGSHKSGKTESSRKKSHRNSHKEKLMNDGHDDGLFVKSMSNFVPESGCDSPSGKSIEKSHKVERRNGKSECNDDSSSPKASLSRKRNESRCAVPESGHHREKSVVRSRTHTDEKHHDRHHHHHDASRARSPGHSRRPQDESHAQSPRSHEKRQHDYEAKSPARSSSVAVRRREAAMDRGAETLSPSTKDKDGKSHGMGERKDKHRSPKDLQRLHTVHAADAGSISRSRGTQRTEKRSLWKEMQNEKKSIMTNKSTFDDETDDRLQRRQSMLESSKKGAIRASVSRQRGLKDAFAQSDDYEDDNDYDDCSVGTFGSYLTAESELDSFSVAPRSQRRTSCSYLPSGLSGTSPKPSLNEQGHTRRRASVFGSSSDRAKVIYSSQDGEDDDSDDESISSKASYMPAGLSASISFDVDRADHNGARQNSRRPSLLSTALTVPIVNDDLSKYPVDGSNRSESRSRRGRELSREDSFKHDKGIEDILKSRRLRGDSTTRSRNRYAQDEKEEEQKGLVDPLKMLSTVGSAGIKGLTTVSNIGIQGVCTVGNAGLNVTKQTVNASMKGISTVGNAGINVTKQTVNASMKGISTVGNAGLNVSKQTVNAGMKGISTVGNAGLNVSKQTVKGLSTVSRQSVKGLSTATQNVSGTLSKRRSSLHDHEGNSSTA